MSTQDRAGISNAELEVLVQLACQHADSMAAMMQVIQHLTASQADMMEIIEGLARELEVVAGLAAQLDGEPGEGDGERTALRAQAAQTRRRAQELVRDAGNISERSQAVRQASRTLGRPKPASVD